MIEEEHEHAARNHARSGKTVDTACERARRDVLPDCGGSGHLHDIRRGLHFLHRKKLERADARAGAGDSHHDYDLPALQQPDHPFLGTSTTEREYRLLQDFLVYHIGARRDFLDWHGPRVASPDLREGTDNIDESFRHHLLLTGGAARISRHRGFGGTDAGDASVGRGQGTPEERRARGCVLVVLAFCRRGLGHGFHRGVRDWTMSETWQTRYARKQQKSRPL